MGATRKRRPRRRRIGKVSYYFHHGSSWGYYLDGQRQVRRRTGQDEKTAKAIAAQVKRVPLSAHRGDGRDGIAQRRGRCALTPHRRIVSRAK